MNVRVHHARGDAPVAADPVVPCVAEILDEDRLLDELARAFPDRSFSEPTTVLDVAYTPHRSLSATFGATEPGGSRIVAVQATVQPASAAPVANGVRVLSGWDAHAWEYPNDPHLPALVRLTDPDAMSGVMRWLAEASHDVTACTPLRYVAGERCVIHVSGPDVEMAARHAATGRPDADHTRLRRLWEHPDREFRMPEPIGFDERLQTRFERMMPGERSDAAPVLGRSVPVDTLCGELVSLHSLNGADPAGATTRLTPGAMLGRLERGAARRLRLAFPHARGRLDTYIEAVRTAAGDLPPSPDAPLHGDLHGGNLLLDEGGPAFVGMDTPAIGHPEFDLALLGTSLFRAALQRGTSVLGVAALIEALPEAYRDAGGATIRGDTYAWHVAATLVGWQADASLHVLAPRADTLTDTLLDTATAVVREGAVAATLTRFAD